MNNEIASAEPLVSVCIPTYNRSSKLKRAVEALLICSYQNLEIIISDNASSDDTQSICTDLTKSDHRVKYFRHDKNQGPARNYKFARAQASGKYFLWLSDDDYFDSDYIKICVDELEHDPYLALVSGFGAYHRADNKLTHYDDLIQLNSAIPLLRAVTFLWSVTESSIFYGVYRVKYVSDCEMPNCLGGDWAWMAEVLLRGKAKMMPMTFIHREYGDSMSSSRRRIVSTLNAPRWHGNFSWLAISVNIANYISFESSEYRNKTILNKIFTYSIISIIFLFKSIIDKIRLLASKVPLAKKIYRRYLKKQVVM